jgi:hypothetical protein
VQKTPPEGQAAVPRSIAGKVDGYPRQPCANAGLSAVAGTLPERAQEAFLCQVVGLVAIPQQRQQQPVDTPLVIPDDCLEFLRHDPPFGDTGRCCFDQRCLQFYVPRLLLILDDFGRKRLN